MIVELDGWQHGDAQHRAHDAERDEYLQSRGFIIVRIWNEAIFANHSGVAEYILDKANERFPFTSK